MNQAHDYWNGYWICPVCGEPYSSRPLAEDCFIACMKGIECGTTQQSEPPPLPSSSSAEANLAT